MASRLFHCEIMNSGDGPLICISGILDHGDWSDDSRPWESAKVIGPGEIKAFQSESSGIMTGTEGHATFTTTTFGAGEGAVHTDFLKIYWDLPYLKLDPADVDPNKVVTIETHRFDPDMARDSFEWDGRDQRPAAISPSVFVSSTPVDFGEQLQNFPELFVGGLAAPFLAPFGVGVNVPDHIYCYLNVAGSVAVEEAPHTVPGFSHDKAIPPNALPLRDSSLDQWLGRWESDHVIALIGPAGDGLDVTVQEKRQTGPYTIQATGVQIERPRLHPYAMKEKDFGAAGSQGTPAGSKLSTRVGTAGKFGLHHDDPKFVAEQSGSSISGDYISLPQDATIEIYRLMEGHAMVGQALKYRRPTSRIIAIESFDELLYRRPNIG
jgi:hypothetical protein